MRQYRIAYINEQFKLQSIDGNYKIKTVCNTVGCAGADENAEIVDCGLIDPECYYDCDLCECICDSSSSSGSSGED